ncbi:MAG TPA: A/G-specific adenine glycosylase [Thermomicrobiales bacterium]|nr:A/G-specific adenine glycosylase [Thermomicrobiales bacterium]
MTTDIPADKIDAVREHLLDWWHANRRDLPWRHTRDPYRIMVSEIMLQQTQVDRVIPYYHRWFEDFPTIHDLASAPTSEVIRHWKGLGYNRRAVNMQRAAQAVVERGGEFPETVEELLDLPGIGPYTAGAIACFAFEQDVPFIDTNMRRVLHRLFIGIDVPKPTASDKDVLAFAEAVIPPGSGWDWNQALIEFGAIHCTARKPLCVICPLQRECNAYPDIQSAIAAQAKAPKGEKQIPFEQTNRFFRGRIVDALREHEGEGVPVTELGPVLKADYSDADLPWLLELVHGLERDGLARVAEDESGYDVSETRIRLP